MPSPGTVRDGKIFRHRLSTRLWHWTNAVTVIVMLMSGLTISNAHPRLYWGQYGANFDAAWLTLPRFPGWATIPTGYNLALARQWHFAFAWVLAFGLLFYLVRSLWNGHFRRDIALSTKEVAPSHLIEDIKQHLRFQFETPGGGYNPLQKIAYSSVLFLSLIHI
jgi:thiosulfate reductase cytochrome b subunit